MVARIMSSKSAKSTFNPLWLILFVIVGGLALGMIKYAGVQIAATPSNNLDNASIAYIAEINGLNLSQYNVTEMELEGNSLYLVNDTSTNERTFALEFIYAQEEASKIRTFIQNVYNLPKTFLFKILKLPEPEWAWIMDVLNLLLWIAVLLGIYFLIRGILPQS